MVSLTDAYCQGMTAKRYRYSHQIRSVLLHVWLQRECRHHRGNMQEKDYVSDKRSGNIFPQENLDVSPKQLVRQPECQPQGHERPEQPGSPAGRQCVGQERKSTRKEKKGLRDVA